LVAAKAADRHRKKENQRIEDPYERVLRAQFADGKLEASTFKQLLNAYQEQKKGSG